LQFLLTCFLQCDIPQQQSIRRPPKTIYGIPLNLIESFLGLGSKSSHSTFFPLILLAQSATNPHSIYQNQHRCTADSDATFVHY